MTGVQHRGGNAATRRSRRRRSKEPAETDDGPPRVTRFVTWVAVTVGSLLLAWAVGTFAPELWDSARQAGGAENLEVTVLYPHQVDSALEGEHREEFIWPMSQSAVPADADRADAVEAGAADAATTLVRLNFHSSFAKRVTIQQIAVNVDRSEPMRGTWITGDQGGGANVRFLLADLDRGTVEWVNAARHPIRPLTIYVDDTEEENVDLLATATECYCRWTIEVTYTVAGSEPEALTVRPPHGSVFRTSSTTAAAQSRPDGCAESPVPGPPLCD